MKILKQATGMSTDWWESLFLIHISLFTVGSSSLAIYGCSEQSLLVPAQPQLEGWLLLYFSGVGRKKKATKNPKREHIEVSRTFGMGTSGPHVEAQPGGKAADREKLCAGALDKLPSLRY